METKQEKAGLRYNRLINEKSPYLLQHALNPVDWYPWGEEAFHKAIQENKPLFLSIGYSTCHWCHVMERESFDNPEVARRMNEVFVCIKVDREERPDIDSVYMKVAQIMTGGGGWPLTIIMTPEKKPFFAGTYLPKENRYNQIGMMELMKQVEDLWSKKRHEVDIHAEKIAQILGKAEESEEGDAPGEELLYEAYRKLLDSFDRDHGGFGCAPKFPIPHNLLFLLRHWKKTENKMPLAMVEMTLREMRRGGIYDHLGFGLHRYSTDEKWLVPHFEKMLYDQALFALVCIEAWQSTGSRENKETAQEIFTYVLRDMTSAEGGFYTAEDADSDGEEGLFYLWKEEDIKNILGEEEGALACRLYNVEREGNYIDSVERRKTGFNILHLQGSLAEIAQKEGLSEGDLSRRLESMRIKLFNERKKRIHPHRDDKILTDWNGLMIAALARGGKVFHNTTYMEAAKQAASFILFRLRSEKGRLLHRYRDGEAGIEATVDDYAFFIFALIELYEATFNTSWLETAIELQHDMTKYFWDYNHGGFFMTANDGERLLSRPKEIYDGALPSGNSVALSNLLRLARMTGDSNMESKAAKLIRVFSINLSKVPTAHTHFLSSLDFALGPAYEIVIVGNGEADDTKALLKSLATEYLPNIVVLLKDTHTEDPLLPVLAPFTKDLIAIDGKATAYVCRNFSCSMPVTRKGDMIKLLRGEKI